MYEHMPFSDGVSQQGKRRRSNILAASKRDLTKSHQTTRPAGR
jgi:hypothetical protein